MFLYPTSRYVLTRKYEHVDTPLFPCPAHCYHLSITHEQVGQYPRMKYLLASCIRHVRSLGIPVETWMVRADTRELLHELHPQQFPDPGSTSPKNFPFKTGNTWLRNSLKRYFFSLRKIGHRMNKKDVSRDTISAIRDFHLKI